MNTFLIPTVFLGEKQSNGCKCCKSGRFFAQEKEENIYSLIGEMSYVYKNYVSIDKCEHCSHTEKAHTR